MGNRSGKVSKFLNVDCSYEMMMVVLNDDLFVLKAYFPVVKGQKWNLMTETKKEK